MLAKGLLVRERSATDARANSVRLSEAGRHALATGSGPAGAADGRLLAFLSSKKREGFVKTLTALARAADSPTSAKDSSTKRKTRAKPAKDKSAKAGKASKAAKSAEAAKAIATPKPSKKQKKAKKAKAPAGV
jgi:hypothetical protein